MVRLDLMAPLTLGSSPSVVVWIVADMPCAPGSAEVFLPMRIFWADLYCAVRVMSAVEFSPSVMYSTPRWRCGATLDAVDSNDEPAAKIARPELVSGSAHPAGAPEAAVLRPLSQGGQPQIHRRVPLHGQRRGAAAPPAVQ